QGVPLLQQLGEARLLVGDTIGDAAFVGRARVGGGLLDELAKIVADHRDALVEFGEVFGVGHGSSLFLRFARVNARLMAADPVLYRSCLRLSNYAFPPASSATFSRGPLKAADATVCQLIS